MLRFRSVDFWSHSFFWDHYCDERCWDVFSIFICQTEACRLCAKKNNTIVLSTASVPAEEKQLIAWCCQHRASIYFDNAFPFSNSTSSPDMWKIDQLYTCSDQYISTVRSSTCLLRALHTMPDIYLELSSITSIITIIWWLFFDGDWLTLSTFPL